MQGGLNIDIQKVREVADYIRSEVGNYDNYVAELYVEFNVLSGYWTGADFDAANAIMAQNKQPLIDLGTTLKGIADALTSAADEYENRINRSAEQFRM